MAYTSTFCIHLKPRAECDNPACNSQQPQCTPITQRKTMKEYIKAIASVNVGDMLTPYCFAIALTVAAQNWTEEDTKDFGPEIRDGIKRLAKQVDELGRDNFRV